MDPDRISSPWARKVVVVFGVLLAANLVLAVVGPSLPEPVTYPTREVQLTVEQLEQQTEAGCVDLLVTGNSLAAHGVSAARLAPALGLETGVVSVLPGSIAEVDVDWMNRVTLPTARPGTVVYVVSPLTFAPEEVVERYGFGLYRRAVATRAGWPGDLQRWAADHSALVRYRTAVADFEALADGAAGELPESYAEILAETGRTVDPDGHIRANGSFGGAQAFLDRLASVADEVEDIWEVDQDQVDALVDHFAGLAEDGTDVAFVIPPVSSALPPVFPRGPSAYDDYLDAARQVGERSGVTTVDLSAAGYADDVFWDTHHLNVQGADRMTGDLAATLGEEGWTACSERQ